jgi:hypothetical protein
MNKKIAAAVAVLSTVLVGVASPAIGAKRQTTAPAHDGFGSAVVVEGLPFTHSTITRGASLEEGEPQPSCGAIARTLWYRFTAGADADLLAETVGQFNTVAVYTGSELGGLTEVACSLGSMIDFAGTAGQTYHFQVGGTDAARGNLTFGLEIDRWKEKDFLAPTTVPVDVPEINAALVKVEGKPRAADPDMYDLTVTVAGQSPISKGIRVGRRLPEIGPVELLKVPAQAVRVTVGVRYRYDVTQQKCILDDGPGQKCHAALPLDTGDPTWAAEEGHNAEMVIDVLMTLNGSTVTQQSLRIPIVGQALAILP